MGNACKCVCRQTDDDEAADALLDGFESQLPHTARPRGPPPPYQVSSWPECAVAKPLPITVQCHCFFSHVSEGMCFPHSWVVTSQCEPLYTWGIGQAWGASSGVLHHQHGLTGESTGACNTYGTRAAAPLDSFLMPCERAAWLARLPLGCCLLELRWRQRDCCA